MVAENKKEHTCGRKQNKNIYVCVYIYICLRIYYLPNIISFLCKDRKKEKKILSKDILAQRMSLFLVDKNEEW